MRVHWISLQVLSSTTIGRLDSLTTLTTSLRVSLRPRLISLIPLKINRCLCFHVDSLITTSMDSTLSRQKHLVVKPQISATRTQDNQWQLEVAMVGPHNLSSIRIPESLCRKDGWRMRNARKINSQEVLQEGVSKAFAVSRSSPPRRALKKRASLRFNFHLITLKESLKNSTMANMTYSSHPLSKCHNKWEAPITFFEGTTTTRASIRGLTSLISPT